MTTDPTDGKPGLRVETAASVIARDMIHDFMGKFALAIRRDRHTSATTTAAYIDGLAGCIALTVAGKHGSREEVVAAVLDKLNDAVNRDLRMLNNV